MKKRIFAAILMTLLAFSMLLPVSAKEGVLYIIDQSGVVTDFIPELNQKASKITDTYGMNVSCLIVESTGGQMTSDYVEQIYHACFEETDGMMLIDNEEAQEWYLYLSGNAAQVISTEEEDLLWAAYANEDYYDECVDAYLEKSRELLEEKAQAGLLMKNEAAAQNPSDEETEENPTAVPVTTETEAAQNKEIPSERLLPLLVDEADLLSDAEEKDLLEKLEEISERQKCDVAVVTVNSMDGKTAEEFADDFYDYNGYGYGKERDGILLLISMEERDWQMSTCGYGIIAFTDAGQKFMADKFTSKLSDGDYNGAFTKYAELCDEFLTQARKGEPYDKGNLPRGSVSPFWIFGDLVIGFVIAVILGLRKKAELKTVVEMAHAKDYEVPGSMMLTVNWDRFVNRVVTTRVIHRDNDSGGSSTHTSSSGTTHGGSGGSF